MTNTCSRRELLTNQLTRLNDGAVDVIVRTLCVFAPFLS